MTKPKTINKFLNDLNSLLRESEITIDFIEGSVSHNRYGFLGYLEDQIDSTALTNLEGLELFKSHSYNNSSEEN